MQDFTEVFKLDPNSPSGLSWKVDASSKKANDFAGYFHEGKKKYFVTYKGKQYVASEVVKVLKQSSKESAVKDKGVDVIQEGSVLNGVVIYILEHGALVSLGKVTGLIPTNEMAWSKGHVPSDYVRVGQEVAVKVTKINTTSKRVYLSLREANPDPWEDVYMRFPLGSCVSGKVKNIVQYGAFVELDKDVQGLLHISATDCNNDFDAFSKMFSVGDTVDVVVIDINKEKHRMALGLKQKDHSLLKTVTEKQTNSVSFWNSFKELVS
jgi:small subunit ribosomal protein S1